MMYNMCIIWDACMWKLWPAMCEISERIGVGVRLTGCRWNDPKNGIKEISSLLHIFALLGFRFFYYYYSYYYYYYYDY